MLKRFAAGLLLLSAMCGISWGAEYDPYNLHFWYTSPDYEADVYGRYGNTDYNFFYQLRDITGANRREQVAGPQWFATVYENYYYGMRARLYNVATNETYPGIYRRTMGGEIPDITLQTVGDLIDGFNFVFIEEPQPYASAWRRYVNREVYDVYPDPVESFCLVITNGQGEFNIDFGNPYARHFPFWWYFTNTGRTNNTTKWWLQTFDWRNSQYPTQEPIAYIYSAPNIYVRNDSVGKYELGYKVATSGDSQIITNASGSSWLYTISGDEIYTSGDVLTWSVNESRDKVYNASGDLVYTIETDTAGDMFICELRNVDESITFSDFGGDYTLTVNPATEQVIPSAGSLSANVRIRSIAPSFYGSRLGYITFRQRASFAGGYTNYREYSTIPVVIANVAEGNAAVEPLMFDMIISDSNDVVVNRVNFTWDAQSDKLDQDLGTFFVIGSKEAAYNLETRITNRTGTRYELYRYDMMGSQNSNPDYRDSHSSIMPDYWTYDIPQDSYGTLPDSFLLDAHSQIAPGLVTVYKKNIGDGYSTIRTDGNTAESFRLTEWNDSAPKNLRLNYRLIGGMTPIESGTHNIAGSNYGNVEVTEFIMQFVDVANDSNNTAEEIHSLTGKLPAMIGIGPLIANTSEYVFSSNYGSDADPAEVSTFYPNSVGACDVKITKTVPTGIDPPLVRLVSKDNGNSTNDNPSPNNPPNNDNPASGDSPAQGVSLRASEIVYESADIPLQPVKIRMRIPRNHNLVADHYTEFSNAENSKSLFTMFSRYGTVWVRSENTGEKDANLFSAINNKGNNLGVSASDIVRAFMYNGDLYLEFIVIMADGKSTRAGMTAYVEIFKDDNVPYVLIGDGKEDGKWDLSFYVDSSAEKSNGGSITDNNSGNTVDNNSGNSGGTPSGIAPSSGGGGGCNSAGIIFAIVIMGMIVKVKN